MQHSLETPEPEIVVLEPKDAPAFRKLRLEGLKRHPEAFGASYEEEAALPLAEIERRLAGAAVFGAFADGELVGVAGLLVPGAAKKRHKGELWGVYVRAGARGAGIGTALVRAVIAHARGRIQQLHTTVVTDNGPARRLYAKLGFRPYGVEPRALKVGERCYDQELLALMLER